MIRRNVLAAPRSTKPRASFLGASEIPVAAGLVPGAIDLYARKVGEADDQEQTDLLEFGHRFEAPIVDAWKARNPGFDTFTPRTLFHPKHPLIGASLDRIVTERGRRARAFWRQGLEVKHVVFHGERWSAEEMPERVVAQAQVQMEVADLPLVTVVAFVAGRYVEVPVERDRELGGMLIEIGLRWWKDHVEARRPPEPDGSDAWAAYIRRRFPEGRAPALEPTEEARDLARRLAAAKVAAARAAQKKDALQQQLQALIGEAEGIEGVCTWRNNRPSQVTDWEAVARELFATPEIVAKHTKPKPGARVLRLSRG